MNTDLSPTPIIFLSCVIIPLLGLLIHILSKLLILLSQHCIIIRLFWGRIVLIGFLICILIRSLRSIGYCTRHILLMVIWSILLILYPTKSIILIELCRDIIIYYCPASLNRPFIKQKLPWVHHYTCKSIISCSIFFLVGGLKTIDHLVFACIDIS